MGIAACGLGALMTKQFADDREPEIAAGAGRGEGMPKIVQPDRTEHSTIADGLPGTLQIVPGVFGPQASNNVVAGARKAFEHSNGRTGKNDRLAAGLAVGKKQHAAFAIKFLPAQVEDFAETAAGEQQKPNGRGGIRRDPGAPIVLANMFCFGI